MLMLLATRLAYSRYSKRPEYQVVTMCVSIAVSYMSLSMTMFESAIHADIKTAETIFSCLVLNIVTGIQFRYLLIANLFILVPWAIVMMVASDLFVFASSAVFTIAFVIFCLIAVGVKETR